ncbi:hypothetical protein TSUD_109300 [Trifolium subterraneum]|nr:hypothetical protein TSUD_109300 [Trifolium subterraneum]
MTLRTPKAIWDYLKEEYAGDERIRSMQVLNLMREFELQRMKESETIKEYSDKLLSIANKVRLLGTEFTDSRIVEKILVTVPERYEASLASLENTKDLSKITLSEVIHALQAHEQRRLMRQDHMVEGALPVKSQKSNTMKNHPSCSENGANNYNRGKGKGKSYPPCQHYGKSSHPPFKYWSRPDKKCSKCNEMGHEAVICRANIQQAAVEAENAQQEEEEDHLFVATCFSTNNSCESWLIDSGCTNHMTYDKALFKHLEGTEVKWVRIGNGSKEVIRYIKGTVHYGVKYCKVKDFKLFGYSDSDWAGSSDDMKSTSGYCFSIGSSVFSWCSKKQEVVAQSTAEAEFVAATNQAIWLRNILADLGLKQEQSTQIFVDNQAAISISYNPVFHGKTKHFNVKLFYLREVQGNGDINLVYCKTEDQAADIFTSLLHSASLNF